jgi:hypothetical protein
LRPEFHFFQPLREHREMLELRPICENCATDLPPAAPDAMICSFECTFCRQCVDTVLFDVCPNCAGGFSPRPIRPAHEWRSGATATVCAPTTTRTHKPVDVAAHAEFAAAIREISPRDR